MTENAEAADDWGMPRTRKTATYQKVYVRDWFARLAIRPADVSRATGITEGYLSELISGRKKNPSPSLLQEIGDATGIPWTAFYQPPPSPDVMNQIAGLDSGVISRLSTAPKQKNRSH